MAWSTSKHRGSTRASRALRTRTLAAWPVCHLRYPGCTSTSTDDDHVIPLAQGGSDHPANHRGACHHCHTIKTQAEAAAGRRAKTRQPERHPGLI